MGVNSLPKTVTRQRRGCDLNPSFCARVQHANHSATEPPEWWLGVKSTWTRRSGQTAHCGVSRCSERIFSSMKFSMSMKMKMVFISYSSQWLD